MDILPESGQTKSPAAYGEARTEDGFGSAPRAHPGQTWMGTATASLRQNRPPVQYYHNINICQTSGARGENRTHTAYGREILSLLRLPIPPPGQRRRGESNPCSNGFADRRVTTSPLRLYFVIRFFVLPGHFVGVETSVIENPLIFVPALSRIATALAILWMYVSKTFWPFGLCSDYSYDQIPALTGFAHLQVLLGAVTLLGAGALLLFCLKRRPILSLAAGIFLFSFAPVSNLLFPIGTIAGERLFFFPSLGFAVALAWLLSKKHAYVIAAAVLVAFWSIVAFTRQSVWLSEERLFLNAAECAPRSVLSLSNAGTVYYFRGDYRTAEKYFEESRAIKPVYSKGLNNLGLVYWKEGRFAEAEKMYFASLGEKYPYDGAIENLILLYRSSGEKEKLLRWLRIAYPNAGDSALRNLF